MTLGKIPINRLNSVGVFLVRGGGANFDASCFKTGREIILKKPSPAFAELSKAGLANKKYSR